MSKPIAAVALLALLASACTPHGTRHDAMRVLHQQREDPARAGIQADRHAGTVGLERAGIVAQV
ncbi:MAG: hypothetical protein J0L88_12905, partial [Xanthomonadales bacterium]|nr:hypothetical protein [Xanthomonadales bacterium]